MADPTVIKDPVYSFEIARRAVGRAALHLGIDSMTEQALDVMADVLLQYLARTGHALSHLAESSRRTSAHVNVLDAFQATQLVASPAVGRLHLQEPEEEEEEDMIASPAPKISDGAAIEGAPTNGNSSTNATASGPSVASSVPINGSSTQSNSISSSSSSSRSSTGWKALASFVFGPNWLQEKDDEEYLMELAAKNGADASTGEARVLSTSGAGGKVFPSSLENGVGGDPLLGGVGDMGTLRRKRKKGWDAPYPDDVPAFPKASSTCANPHALPARVTGGLSSAAAAASGSTAYRKVDVDAKEADEDEQEALDELEALSDEVFLPHPESMKNSDTAAVGDSAWGSIDGKSKQNLENLLGSTAVTKDEDGDVEMQQPSSKKVKFENNDRTTKAGNAKGESLPKKEAGASKTTPAQEEFLYVPTFYPRPPSTKVVVDDRRTVVDGIDDRQQRLLQQQRAQQQQEQQVFASEDSIEALEGTSNNSSSLRGGNAMNMDSSRGVRSSLIRLGNSTSNSYWGSGWEKASSSASSAPTLAVPMGRKASGPSASGGPGGRAAAPDDPIIPMSRASGSRVSRVLEGSMDAAAMQ